MEPLSSLKDRKKSPTQLTRSSKIFKTIIAAIQDKKGEHIISLDLRKVHEAVADFFIICEANNAPQLKAIIDNIDYEVKTKCDELPYKSCVWGYRPYKLQNIDFLGNEYKIVPKKTLVDMYGKDWNIVKKFDYYDGIENNLYKGLLKDYYL